MTKEISLNELKETIDTLLLISQRQLQVLEFSKDQPHTLDRNIFAQALNMFQKQEDILPQLRESCDRWTRKILSPQEKRDVKKLKQGLEKLSLIHQQVMFLMENLQEYTEVQDWSENDFQEAFSFLESMDEKYPNHNLNPQELIDEFIALKKQSLENNALPDEPLTESQERNYQAYLKIKELVHYLILEKIHPKVIQGSLFCQWLHMVSLFSATPEDYFNQLVSKADKLMIRMINRLNEISRLLTDDGPTEEMEQVGEMVEYIRSLVKERFNDPIPERKTDKIPQLFLDLLEELKDIPVAILASHFLYFWVRLSTMESDVPEVYFQKLDRNWDEVFSIVWQDALSMIEGK